VESLEIDVGKFPESLLDDVEIHFFIDSSFESND